MPRGHRFSGDHAQGGLLDVGVKAAITERLASSKGMRVLTCLGGIHRVSSEMDLSH